MKNLIVSSATCLLFISCSEKKISASDVPTQVITTFNSKYPNPTEVEWEKEKKDGKTVYEAEFKYNGKEMEAKFESNGNFIKEE